MAARLPKMVKDAIASFPGEDGWWHTSGQESFERLARRMLSYDIPKEDVVDILGCAYGDVANEFGS